MVCAVALLLLGLGSGSVPVTVTVLLKGTPTGVTWVGVTTIVTVALAPLANPPKLQLIVGGEGSGQLPWLGVADTKLTPAGRVSLTITPVAAAGPLFVTVTV